MFENIPNIYLTVGVALAIAGFIAVIMCVSRFLENEKDNALKMKEAKLYEMPVDEVNVALSKKFWFGYLVVAVVGAGISSMLALIATDIIGSLYAIGDEGYIVVVCAVLALAFWLIGDKYLFTRLGDGAYFARVESHAIDLFLSGDIPVEVKEPEVAPAENVPDTDEVPKENSGNDIKSRISGMTNEEKIALLDALLK